jgi:hypothetical protein
MIKWIKEKWSTWRAKRRYLAEQNLIEDARYWCMTRKHELPNFDKILTQIEDDEARYRCRAWSHKYPMAQFPSPDSIILKKEVTGKVNAYYVARYMALELDDYYDGYRGIQWEMEKVK